MCRDRCRGRERVGAILQLVSSRMILGGFQSVGTSFCIVVESIIEWI